MRRTKGERRTRVRRRALVVSADVLLRIELRLLLELQGYQVEEVGDGMEAIGLLDVAALDLDLVVLDYAMPQLNGLETYEVLRAIRPGLRALVCVPGIEALHSSAIPTTASFLRVPCTAEELHDALACARQAAGSWLPPPSRNRTGRLQPGR